MINLVFLTCLFFIGEFSFAFSNPETQFRTASGGKDCPQIDVDYTGYDIFDSYDEPLYTDSWEQCASQCLTIPECVVWVWINERNPNEFWYHSCFPKSSSSGGSFNRSGWISGHRSCDGQCQRPSSGCVESYDIYKSVDCDGDGILDHACSTTINNNRWLVLSSEGCPNSWGSGSRPASKCPQAFEETTIPTTITTTPTPTTTTATCEDIESAKYCKKAMKKGKCSKASIWKKCQSTCKKCDVEEPCEDQKSSKYCKKALKKEKCGKSSIWKKCKKTCDKC